MWDLFRQKLMLTPAETSKSTGRTESKWGRGRPSLNASIGVLACDPSRQPCCYNGLHQSLWEGTKTEELRYLAHGVEIPIRKKTGRRKYGKKEKEQEKLKRTERKTGKMEKSIREASFRSQAFLTTPHLFNESDTITLIFRGQTWPLKTYIEMMWESVTLRDAQLCIKEENVMRSVI